MTAQEFLKLVNTKRLQNKGQWFTLRETVEGKTVEVKNYNLYLQIYRVDGIDHTPAMGINATAWKQAIKQPFNL